MKQIKTPKQLKDAITGAGIILITKGGGVVELSKEHFDGLFTDCLNIDKVTAITHNRDAYIEAYGKSHLTIHRPKKREDNKETKERLFYLSDTMDFTLK